MQLPSLQLERFYSTTTTTTTTRTNTNEEPGIELGSSYDEVELGLIS